MADGHKDYSGTPLWKKLGISQGARVLVMHAPESFARDLVRIAPLPHAVEFLSRNARGLDVAVVFATSQADLERAFTKVHPNLEPTGRLWVAWPKRASKVPTDITFESAQGFGLASGMVDNKSAAIDDVFQGLQFVVRVKDRQR
ncbi:MAG: DUF3052 domain-containing protein [Actinomycetota bacterium]